MPETVSFTLTNELTLLEDLARRIEDFARPMGFSDRGLFELHLAVEELFTNIVSYAYEDALVHSIHVALWEESGRMAIRIEDDGRPFDPLTAKEPDTSQAMEDRPVGKLGIFLTKRVMDELSYERRDGKNIVVLKKKPSR